MSSLISRVVNKIGRPYVVPQMTLIPQQKTMSCWYASAQMLVHWKMEMRQQSLMGLVPPDLDAECRKIRDADSGIANSQILAMARRLGLRSVPPLSPTPAALENWLRTYGPLWVNGKTHIVVIAGIWGSWVKVYDPSPKGVGRIDWRSLADWYIGDDVDSRDTGSGVETVFLHCP